MKSLDIPIVITPTLTLPRQRGRGIPGVPDENKLAPGITSELGTGDRRLATLMWGGGAVYISSMILPMGVRP